MPGTMPTGSGSSSMTTGRACRRTCGSSFRRRWRIWAGGRPSSSGTRTSQPSKSSSMKRAWPSVTSPTSLRKTAVLTLREIEAAFSRALLGRDERLPSAEVLVDGLAAGARLQIYRHQVFTTLTAGLRATYPVVCRLVDERFFGYAADQYVQSYPPRGPCLFEYGGSFPEFLAEFEPCRHLRYLPDVARLEWALHAAIHAEDVEPLDPARLRGLPEDELPQVILCLDPSLALLTSRLPIDRIFRVNQPEAEPGTS